MGKTVETVSDFFWGGSKITADGDCSHEIKRHLILGRTVMTNLDSILKSRDITLPTKVHGALERPKGRVWGGRREEGSGWGTHVYLWRIHFDIWQN